MVLYELFGGWNEVSRMVWAGHWAGIDGSIDASAIGFEKQPKVPILRMRMTSFVISSGPAEDYPAIVLLS